MTVVGCGGEEEETDKTLTGTVRIDGSHIVGQTLTALTNNLRGSGTISYQWKRNGTTNIGTNSSTYVVQAADVDSTITVTVTRAENIGSVTSGATETIIWPSLTGTVSIEITDSTGTVVSGYSAKVGDTLTANTADLGGSGTISYQWRKYQTNIIDANSRTYVVQTADVPSIYVRVTRAENRGKVSDGVITRPAR